MSTARPADIRGRANPSRPVKGALSLRSTGYGGLAPFTLVAALPTPFRREDVRALDERRFSELVARLVEAGMRDLLVGGVAGEGSTLTDHERERLIHLAVEAADGRAAVIAATGTYSTAQTIARTRAAEAAGAAAAFLTVPYYSKPTQAGIVAHFEAVAAASGLPLIVSNVFARTGIGLAPHTVARLSAVEHVRAIELAPCGVEDRELARLVARDGRPPVLLGGVDAEAFVFRLAGGHGCISATATVAPRLCLALHQACSHGQWATARRVEAQLRPLVLALGPDCDPARLKHALARRHGWGTEPRLPLVSASPKEIEVIDAALDASAFE